MSKLPLKVPPALPDLSLVPGMIGMAILLVISASGACRRPALKFKLAKKLARCGLAELSWVTGSAPGGQVECISF